MIDHMLPIRFTGPMIFGDPPQSQPRAYLDIDPWDGLWDLDLPDNSKQFLSAVSRSSPYLARLIQKEAEFLERNMANQIEKVLQSAAKPGGEIEPALRRAKSRMALCLGLTDLAGLRPQPWISQALSDFADLMVDTALRHCLAKHRADLPKDALKDGATAGLFVLAMGKMGAGELNYSSDIDLIFFFDPAGIPNADAQELRATLIRVVKETTALLSRQTADGYVFRTDLRLRPNPSVTPVCSSVQSAQNYYLQHGRTWERAAFIKARVCAGDKSAGQKFLDGLQDFIWRKALDFAALAEVEEQLSLTRSHKGLTGKIDATGHNLKLGRGGIREIEFFTQSKQLIYGGRRKDLRVSGTLSGLDALVTGGLLNQEVADALKANYKELRTLEHRIQMLRDAQTHTVPSGEDADRMAALSGLDDTQALFQQITDIANQTETLTQKNATNTLDPVTPDLPAIDQFDAFKTTPALNSDRAQASLDQIAPRIWNTVQDLDDPVDALAQFGHFLSALPRGVEPLAMLEQNNKMLRDVIHIASLSRALATELGQNFERLYVQIDPQKSPPELDPKDIEDALIGLRKWKNEAQFQIIHDQILGGQVFDIAERAYTQLAETVLQRAVEIALAETRTKHGNIAGSAPAVLAMGKLGSGEMTARSDLDLLILYQGDPEASSDGERSIDLRGYYTYFTRRLITALTINMAGGTLYEVDMRLRPSGRAGTVATSLTGFEEYQREKAWVWEHLALTRARAVAGDPDLLTEIEAIKADILAEKSNNPNILKELADMRGRLDKLPDEDAGRLSVKKPLGGVLDIELIAQTFALRNNLPHSAPRDQLSAAQEKGAIDVQTATQLIDTHAFYARLEHLKRLLSFDLFQTSDLGSAGLKFLLDRMGMNSIDLLQSEIADRIAKTRKLLDTLINQMDQS